MACSELHCKAKEEAIEHIELSDSSKDQEQAHGVGEFSDAERRRIIRKVDFRIIFPLGLMLAAGFLDRANVGNAAIAG